MPKEALEIVITADNSKAVAELNELGQRLQTFEKQIKKATDSETLIRLQKSINDTKAKMESLNSTINPLIANTSRLGAGSNQAAQALTNVGRVAQDLPFGFMGIQNNLNPLLESFQRLKAESGSTGGALKALAGSLMGAGGVGLALSVASSAFLIFGDRLFDSGKKAEAAKKAFDDITAGIAKDAATITQLVEKYKDANLTLGQRKAILDQLNRVSPEYFGGLDKEKTTYDQLTKASDAYIKSLTKQVQLKVLQAQYEKNIDKLLQNQVENEKVKALQADFARKNRTGQTPTGLPQNAKLEQENKLLLNQIAALTVIEDKKDKIGLGKKEKQSPLSSLMENYKEDIRALVMMLMDGGTTITEFTKDLDRLNTDTLKKFFKEGGDAASEFGKQLIALQPRFNEFGNIIQRGQIVKQERQNAPQPGLVVKQLEDKGIKQDQLAAPVKNLNEALTQTQQLMGIIGPEIDTLFNALANGVDIGQTVGDMFKNLALDIAKAAAKAAIFSLILSAITGGASNVAGAAGGGGFMKIFKNLLGLGGFAKGGVSYGPQGGHMELLHGTEAVLTPAQMSGLVRNSLNAGAVQAMGQGDGQNMNITGEFVARGQDLVLALQRSNYSLNLRRG